MRGTAASRSCMTRCSVAGLVRPVDALMMPAHRAVSLSDEHPEPEPHDSEARASFTGVTGGVMWPRPASQGYQAGSPIDCVVEGPGRAVLSNMRSSSSSAVAGRCSASPERMGTSGGPRFGVAGNIANKHTCSAGLHHDMACVCDGARSELICMTRAVCAWLSILCVCLSLPSSLSPSVKKVLDIVSKRVRIAIESPR